MVHFIDGRAALLSQDYMDFMRGPDGGQYVAKTDVEIWLHQRMYMLIAIL
jgi:hypothetical protein